MYISPYKKHLFIRNTWPVPRGFLIKRVHCKSNQTATPDTTATTDRRQSAQKDHGSLQWKKSPEARIHSQRRPPSGNPRLLLHQLGQPQYSHRGPTMAESHTRRGIRGRSQSTHQEQDASRRGSIPYGHEAIGAEPWEQRRHKPITDHPHPRHLRPGGPGLQVTRPMENTAGEAHKG